MTTRFVVQGRVVKWHSGRIVRDEVRSAETDTRDKALRTARGFAEQGLTVWIFQLRHGTGIAPVYQLVHREDGH